MDKMKKEKKKVGITDLFTSEKGIMATAVGVVFFALTLFIWDSLPAAWGVFVVYMVTVYGAAYLLVNKK